jgi:cell division protein FtsL
LDLLNAFYEENQALKRADSITDLETQIMHLKQENQGLHRKVEAMSKELCNCEEDYIMEEYL